MTAEPRPIRVMPPDLVLKIAAGEVVERPASAVKELVDNALDAGATSIAIEIREAGLKLIRVLDNGSGMRREDLPLAFTSHATSKIRRLDDLEQLATLGFRGEALPSIAAVSRVEVQTRADAEYIGTRFQVFHGEPGITESCSLPRGTRMSISDLFANVPARRKFVRSLRSEAGQIHQVVMQYALAQPGVQFTLTMDGRLTFHVPGNGDLGDAAVAVYGSELVGKIIPIHAADHGMEIEGLISHPSLTRSNRTAITFAVNGRPIANRSLVFALEEAYSGFVMVGRHPLAIVHLRLPPAEVDANVHPSKSEVRLARDREVHGAVHRAVAAALFEIRLASQNISGVEMPALDAPLEPPPQPSLVDDRPQDAPQLSPGMPMLRVVGQTNATFIVAEGPQGLYMIDQHAAHERILFDQLDEQLGNGGLIAQPLLDPAPLDLTPPQMLALEENRSLLLEAGFDVEPFGDTACIIRSVPGAGRSAPTELVIEVLDELQNLPQPEAAREKALAAMACKAAVKAGQPLSVEEMRELILQLERTPRPSTCPHGRPTMIHLSHSQLEREFGRR